MVMMAPSTAGGREASFIFFNESWQHYTPPSFSYHLKSLLKTGWSPCQLGVVAEGWSVTLVNTNELQKPSATETMWWMCSFAGMEGGRGRTRRRHEWRCVWTDRDDGSMEGRACQGPVLVVVVVAALLWCWLMDGSFASTFTVNTKKAQERDRPAEWMSGRLSRYSQRHTAWKTSEKPQWDVLTSQPDASLTPWDVC